jgi:hypothetical protein
VLHEKLSYKMKLEQDVDEESELFVIMTVAEDDWPEHFLETEI